MSGTGLSTIAEEVSKMLFISSISFLSGVGDNQEMTRMQGAECANIGKLGGLSGQEVWAGTGRMRSVNQVKK